MLETMISTIAFLIPTTSKNHDWKSPVDSYLYKYTLSTLKMCHLKKYKCIFYIGFDHDDSFYTNKRNQEFYKKTFPYFTFKFIKFDAFIKKGYLTKMWNILYYNALTDDNFFIQYFYQCGDDIIFKTPNWLDESVALLKLNNDVGISGPRNGHPHLLTQALVSRKHYAIFNCLFPECIVNWGCDDWLNYIYSPSYLNPAINEFALNAGGNPRYDVNKLNEIEIKKMAYKLARNDKVKITKYLSNNKSQLNINSNFNDNDARKNSFAFALSSFH